MLCPGVAVAQSKKEFRVCADPENMPFSNRQMQGFENKIATVVAKAFDASPSYVWWGQRRGFIRNTMNATLKEGRCNIMIGAPQGYDLVRTTKPYYRSTYVFVYRKDKGLQIKSMDDPMLKTLRIGVHLLGEDYNNPPPVFTLSKRGIVGNVTGFETFYSAQNHRAGSWMPWPPERSEVAIVWGPAVGYFVKHQQVWMEMVPVPAAKGDLPLAFDISMGVQPGDDELRAKLEKVLLTKHVEITNILKE